MPTASSTSPVAIDHHALGTLQFIRGAIESASGFDVPGSAGIAMGGVGVFAAALAATGNLRQYMLQIWLAAACVALTVGGAIVLRQGRDPARAIYRASLRRFLLSLLPALFAGAVLTFVLAYVDLQRLLPGLWLLLYGAAVLSASTLTAPTAFRPIALMATLFMVAGPIAFVTPMQGSNAVMGLCFGGLHLLFGLVISRKARHGR